MTMYRVKLTDFEGPLDLLLFFIKRDELDITDIPISKITNDFVSYLHLMASLDLDVAGEFIVMAATLMQIKVRMLLPHVEGLEEEEDPRAELVRRLIEYKRYKEMSQKFSGMEDEQRKILYRGFHDADPRILEAGEEKEQLQEVSLFNLIAAYKSALDHMPRKVVHEVTLLNVSVDEQMSFVLDFLRINGPSTLLVLARHLTAKLQIIVTVIAILELTKNGALHLRATEGGDDILLTPVAPGLPLSRTTAA
jgi:segregation and condensation protein A